MYYIFYQNQKISGYLISDTKPKTISAKEVTKDEYYKLGGVEFADKNDVKEEAKKVIEMV